MKLLLDECLDWRLRRELSGHEVRTVQEMGWQGIKNGRLLALAQAEFQVFITGDRNLSFNRICSISRLLSSFCVQRASGSSTHARSCPR